MNRANIINSLISGLSGAVFVIISNTCANIDQTNVESTNETGPATIASNMHAIKHNIIMAIKTANGYLYEYMISSAKKNNCRPNR